MIAMDKDAREDGADRWDRSGAPNSRANEAFIRRAFIMGRRARNPLCRSISQIGAQALEAWHAPSSPPHTSFRRNSYARVSPPRSGYSLACPRDALLCATPHRNGFSLKEGS